MFPQNSPEFNPAMMGFFVVHSVASFKNCDVPFWVSSEQQKTPAFSSGSYVIPGLCLMGET
jgi:hypothetical protein